MSYTVEVKGLRTGVFVTRCVGRYGRIEYEVWGDDGEWGEGPPPRLTASQMRGLAEVISAVASPDFDEGECDRIVKQVNRRTPYYG